MKKTLLTQVSLDFVAFILCELPCTLDTQGMMCFSSTTSSGMLCIHMDAVNNCATLAPHFWPFNHPMLVFMFISNDIFLANIGISLCTLYGVFELGLYVCRALFLAKQMLC